MRVSVSVSFFFFLFGSPNGLGVKGKIGDVSEVYWASWELQNSYVAPLLGWCWWRVDRLGRLVDASVYFAQLTVEMLHALLRHRCLPLSVSHQ